MKNWKEQLTPRTLAELYGNERLLVEEHRGILAYGESCIRIGTGYGALVVEGADLRLCCMSRTQVVIRGRIDMLRTEATKWT